MLFNQIMYCLCKNLAKSIKRHKTLSDWFMCYLFDLFVNIIYLFTVFALICWFPGTQKTILEIQVASKINGVV